MNYTELVAAIKDYTQNYETTFVAEIPTFVRQAEERIVRSVTIPELRKNVTGTTTASNQYLARPTDFLSVLSLAVDDGTGAYSYVYDKDVSFIREAYPSATTTGVPKYYAMFDGDVYSGSSETGHGSFILAPTPDDAYTVELHYYYDPPSIVDTGTSWLGDNAETALLYGSLLEAYTFMKGDADLLQVYKLRYDDAMDKLFGLNTKLRRDSYRNGEPK